MKINIKKDTSNEDLPIFEAGDLIENTKGDIGLVTGVNSAGAPVSILVLYMPPGGTTVPFATGGQSLYFTQWHHENCKVFKGEITLSQ